MKPYKVKRGLKFAAYLLILVAGVSCSGVDGVEMVQLDITDYSLEEVSCQWQNIRYDANTLIVINSMGELASYTTCAEEELPTSISQSIPYCWQAVPLAAG